MTVGSFKIFHGQRYECMSVKPYIRKDGVAVLLASWQSHCATCGQPFEFDMTVETWDRETFTGPTRRCKEHRQPGLKVRHEALTAGKLRFLKMNMATAHPDKGGTSADFIEAREVYVEAKRRLET